MAWSSRDIVPFFNLGNTDSYIDISSCVNCLLYGNNLFNAFLRSSHPQSSPNTFLASLSTPVAFNIFSTDI